MFTTEVSWYLKYVVCYEAQVWNPSLKCFWMNKTTTKKGKTYFSNFHKKINIPKSLLPVIILTLETL